MTHTVNDLLHAEWPHPALVSCCCHYCHPCPYRPNKRSKAGSSDSSSSSSSSHITLKGGTDAAFAPPIGYLQHVFLPTVKRLIGPLASEVSLNVLKRGFYPKGGGVVQLTVPALTPGTPLPAWQLTERGHLVRITGLAVTAGKLRPDIAQRMATAAKQHLKAALKDSAVLFGAAHARPSSGAGPSCSSPATAATGAAGSKGAVAAAAGCIAAVATAAGFNAAAAAADGSNAAPAAAAGSGAAGMAHSTPPGSSRSLSSIPSVVVDIEAVQEPPERATGDGGSIVLIAETSTGCLFGASALAERGVTAEAVGTIAARDLLEELRSGAAVDQW
jgi:RNA 3'-terminal phosphate cyclase